MLFRVFFCVFWIGIFSGNIISAEVTENYYADQLNKLELFKGTNEGYELDAFATRAQGAVMLVRYIGVEEEVLSAFKDGSLKHPFADVPSWASAHVAYLYQHGLTIGISSNEYGSEDAITANQYGTMLLRMLGFDDSNGDFEWDEAINFIQSNYDIDEDLLTEYKIYASKGMIRDILVKLSYSCIDFEFNGSEYSVLEKLLSDKVISMNQYNGFQDKRIQYQSNPKKDNSNDYAKDNANEDVKDNEVRAIWLSYLDLKPMILNQSESNFRSNIKNSFNKINDAGFNTVYVQVRPFSDALYKSDYYPWSHIINGTEGVDPGYDPLYIMITEAKALNLKIEAWINPYRVRTNVMVEPLSENSSISRMIKENNRVTIRVNNTVVLNPAYENVQQLIINGVQEIIENYDVDGIHFDDYFYPSGDLTLDREEYDAYVSQGGNLSHGDFRREQINMLIRNVYKTIKAYDASLTFGISPQGNFGNNYDETFIDIDKWVHSEGYIDYVCPQIYYGFENETSPFIKSISEWNDLVKDTNVKLYIGLAAYKIGLEDRWAGTGINEWKDKSDQLMEMINKSRKLINYGGVAVFRYESLFIRKEMNEQVSEELTNIERIFINSDDHLEAYMLNQ